MNSFRVAGHSFEGDPSFFYKGVDRVLGVVIPYDTDRDVIYEVQNAEELEVFNKHGELMGTHRLTGWLASETVFSNNKRGLSIVWSVVNPEHIKRLQGEIDDLKTRNEELIQENATLTDALLELAEIIGGEET